MKNCEPRSLSNWLTYEETNNLLAHGFGLQRVSKKIRPFFKTQLWVIPICGKGTAHQRWPLSFLGRWLTIIWADYWISIERGSKSQRIALKVPANKKIESNWRLRWDTFQFWSSICSFPRDSSLLSIEMVCMRFSRTMYLSNHVDEMIAILGGHRWPPPERVSSELSK